MTTEEKDELRFRVARHWASEELDKQRCNYSPDYTLELLNHKGLDDARCLVRMIVKEVESHNSAIKSKQTLLRNLRYSRKWLSSSLFTGLNIPYKKIDELIAANPDTESYTIYLKLITR